VSFCSLCIAPTVLPASFSTDNAPGGASKRRLPLGLDNDDYIPGPDDRGRPHRINGHLLVYKRKQSIAQSIVSKERAYLDTLFRGPFV
jgi:hypothetical protein